VPLNLNCEINQILIVMNIAHAIEIGGELYICVCYFTYVNFYLDFSS
jgi:hypothetical protein